MDQIQTTTQPSVLHVIADAGPHPYFRTLIEAGGLERATLSVGCVGPAGALQEDMHELGVSTFALGARTRRTYPIAVARLASLLRRRRIEVVQTHLVDGSLVGLAAARIARTPVAVMTAHHSHELPFHGRRLAWPERVCTGPLCDHIVAPSAQVADTLVRYAGVARTKIEVVHHGFDLERLDPDGVDGHSVRRELGLEGRLVFGAIGRIYELKNYPALIQAFAAALGGVDEARLVIVGPGDAAPLRSIASDLGVADRVVLCGPRADVSEVLAAFDVFVHPAIAESFGMVIVEAMAMARPVLSTAVGIAPEVIEPSNGVLSASPRADDLAAALREMLALRSRWPEMGDVARRSVADYTASAMARRHQALWIEWLKATRRGLQVIMGACR